MANNTEKDTRSKTWNLIVYPESAPEGWKELLVEDGISFVCSPLHDKDILPTGEIKK
ncbi:Rep family protein, partial [Staphylococcus caprae]|nr:Rep family protein [Bacillus cereus]